MSRLLVFGVGPYPTEPHVTVSGPSIRLRQFIDPLTAAGHEVSVIMAEAQPRHHIQIKRTIHAAALPPREILEPWKVMREMGEREFDAVIGAGAVLPTAAAARMAVHIEKPLWADFCGDPLAELHSGTSRAGVRFDSVVRDQIWRFVREALNAGDRFSTISSRQRSSLLGQLILIGRAIETESAHHRLHTIPFGVPNSWVEEPFDPGFPDALVEEGINPETPYIYIGGQWAPWLDEERMGKILARVLKAEPMCNLVIRAHAADPLANAVRKAFFAALGEDAPAARVHELDRQVCGEAELLAYASATLLIERDIPESYLGCFSRLLSFVRWGLRPVISAQSELAQDLLENGLVLSSETADDSEYVRLLRKSLHDRAGEFIERQKQGVKYLARLTFEQTCKPLLEWAEQPDRWGAPIEEGLLPRWRREIY